MSRTVLVSEATWTLTRVVESSTTYEVTLLTVPTNFGALVKESSDGTWYGTIVGIRDLVLRQLPTAEDLSRGWLAFGPHPAAQGETAEAMASRLGAALGEAVNQMRTLTPSELALVRHNGYRAARDAIAPLELSPS